MQPLMNEYGVLEANESMAIGNRGQLLEKTLRYNLLNPIHAYALRASRETNEYVMQLSASLHGLINRLILESGFFGMIIIVAAVAFLLEIRRRLVPFFSQTINFRQVDLSKFISVGESVRLAFTSLQSDEYSTMNSNTFNLDAIISIEDINTGVTITKVQKTSSLASSTSKHKSLANSMRKTNNPNYSDKNARI